MNGSTEFLIETGVDIYDMPPRRRSGIWKEIALQMKPPKKGQGGKVLHSSVGKTKGGVPLTRKQATALCNALSGIGSKGMSRRDKYGNYRVWRML